MKATIDIPDELYREVKIKAAQEGRPLREVVIDALSEATQPRPVPRRKVVVKNGIPVIELGLKGKIPALTNEQIAELLD
jgi:hypothetical protein